MAEPTVPIYAQSDRAGITELCPSTVGTILDVGGSTGEFAAHMKRHLGAERVYVADYSEKALDVAKSKVDDVILVNLNKEGQLANALARRAPVDLVFCLCVLEHLYDPWRVVAELHTALPIGATIVTSVPNSQQLRFVWTILTGNWKYRNTGLFDRTHIRFFSEDSAVKLMTGTGLQLVKVKRRILSKKLAKLNTLTLRRFELFFAFQIEIAVRKVSDEVFDPGFCGARIAGA
ncbi:class I SAM-dependent methyltransferase [Sphingomonas faeni]|uniref:class I SAM-dependent methyltransferase n=1 Tax=Sphingomonas faeni TaxID=185950 RepID=UPI002788A481|nr:class I SAM-dependent methyltransferase [Sphingomonas faeni]MDQ0838827.1 2-polyprenyl-3-methyl-5-hydroxy-6-metoxy-1,4-benzoquinol methylase [Sphingomonas faeni]